MCARSLEGNFITNRKLCIFHLTYKIIDSPFRSYYNSLYSLHVVSYMAKAAFFKHSIYWQHK